MTLRGETDTIKTEQGMRDNLGCSCIQPNQYGGEFVGATVRVIPALIPSVEKQLLCATFLEAVIRFYENPENMRSFEQWRNEKGGSVYGSEGSGNAAGEVS